MLQDVTVVVPTRGRVGRQHTLENLPPAVAERTWLACPESEAEEHDWPRLMVHPEGLEAGGGMGAKRQWIMDSCKTPVLVLFDDDLRFHVRTTGVKLAEAQPQDVVDAVEWMVAQCLGGDAVQAGLSLRGGNNHVEGFSKRNGRCTAAAFAMNVGALRTAGIRWRLPLMEDLDVVLQLLRQGLHNEVAYHWCVSQKTGAEGGCSTFRTERRQTQAARRLRALHPDFVKVVVKPAGTWPGMGAFCDVRVSWAKAAGGA